VKRFCLLIALTVVLASMCAPMSAGAAESGLVVNSTTASSPQISSSITGTGVSWVRGFLPWSTFEPSAGHLDLSQLNDVERWLAGLPQGTKVILDVLDTPSWESGSTNPATPPRDPTDYAAFVGAMAKRFAGRVAAWEIWNEEDESFFWSTGADPAAYTALLKATYPAVKAADPNATVVLGGLTGNDYEYLEQLYKQGAKGSFDAVAVHTDTICDVESPYDILRNGRDDPRINRWSFLGYRTVHEVMQANGDGSPIWMTELGWSTSSQICNSGAWAGQKPGGVSPQEQATFLLQAYHCLAQDPYVKVGIWYSLQEGEPFGSPRGSYGLLDGSLAAKPAYGALADYAHNGDRLTETCGGSQGPAIQLKSPKTGVRYTNTLPITVSASDSVGIYEITLYDDGHIIRNFSAHPAVSSLSGHMTWYGARLLTVGKHILTAKAIDLRNNTSSTSITIVRAKTPPKHKHKKHKKHKKRHPRRKLHVKHD
jgi:hypothetical protein